MPQDTRDPGAGDEVERTADSDPPTDPTEDASSAASTTEDAPAADAVEASSGPDATDTPPGEPLAVDDVDVEISVEDAGGDGVSDDDAENLAPLVDPASINLSDEDILSIEAEVDAEVAEAEAQAPGGEPVVEPEVRSGPPTPPRGPGAPPMPRPAEAAELDVTAAAPPVPTIAPHHWETKVPTALDEYLERAAGATPESRAEILAHDLDIAPPERKGELAYELGELQLALLGDEARAVKAYGVALRADPSLRANLWAIRRVFYRRGLWPNLIKLIGAELRFVDSDRARADLELEKGRIQEDKLDEPENAKAAYSRAVAHDPTYLPALHALERRCLIDGDRDGLAQVLRPLADVYQTPERVLGYLLDLARIQVEQGSAEAAATLDEAAALGVELDRVARERMRAARGLGDAEMMVVALEERVAAALANLGPAGLPDPAPRDTSEPPSPAEAIRLQIVASRRRQAQVLFGELKDAERAWSALERALVAAPTEELVLADLADLAEAAGRFEDLAELVESWQAQEAEPERARALALRRVHALQRGGDLAAASELLDQLAASYRGYVPVAAAREGVAMAAGDLVALGAIYAELGASAEAGTLFGEGGIEDRPAAARYFMAAGAAAQLAGDVDGARSHYAHALEADASSEAARDGLLTCLEAAGDYEAATAALEASPGSTDAERAVRSAHAALARGDVAAAAIALDAAKGELCNDELLWLAAIALEVGDAAAECGALAAAAERSTDPADAAELYGRAARVIEGDDPRRAIDLYRLALVQRGEDQLIRGCLLALLRRTQDWEALAQDLRDAASTGSDSRGSVAAWLELASVLEDRREDVAGAAEAYREALALDSDNLPAMMGLIRVTRGAEHVDALGRAAISADPITRLDASLCLAQEHLAAGDVDAALEAANRAADAERDAGLATSVANLLAIEIAARIGQPEALAEVLERTAARANATTGASLIAAAGWERAIAGTDPGAAAALFGQALELSPANRSALLGSVVVASSEGGSASLAHAEALAETLEGNTLAVAILRAAGVAAAIEGDEATAARLLARAVVRAPDDFGAAIALTEMSPSDAEHAAALATAWGRRALAESGAELRTARFEQAAALMRAGRLAEAGALALDLARSDRIDPAPAALLVEICRRGADVAGEASAVLELSSRVVGAEAQARTLRRAAQLFDAVLADTASAARAYRRLLEVEPEAPERARLVELLAADGDLASLWNMLGDQIELCKTDVERTSALQSRAALRAGIDDRVGALRDLDRVLELAPESTAALALKAELEVELESASHHGDGETAAAAIIERSASQTDHAARARDLVELAAVYADVLGDQERATDALSAAFALDPTNLEAASSLDRLEEARDAIVASLERTPDHRGGYQKLAAVLAELGGAPQSALALEASDALSASPRTDALDVSVLAETKRPLDPRVWDHLGAIDDDGAAFSALWEHIADAVSRGVDPKPGDLGLGLGDRSSVRELASRSPVAAALYERLRLRAEVYLVSDRPGWALATSANRAMIFLAPDVADAATPAARFTLGSALTMSRERTGTLAQLSTARLATYFSAARSLAGVEAAPLAEADAAEVPAAIEELERLLPSRIVTALAHDREALATVSSVERWRERQLMRANRFGLAVSGNIRAAATAAAGPGRRLRDDHRALGLLVFAASADHLSLREALGLEGSG